MSKRPGTSSAQRYGRAFGSEEDRIDGAIVDVRLRDIAADPGRLVAWKEVKRQLGLSHGRRRG